MIVRFPRLLSKFRIALGSLRRSFPRCSCLGGGHEPGDTTTDNPDRTDAAQTDCADPSAENSQTTDQIDQTQPPSSSQSNGQLQDDSDEEGSDYTPVHKGLRNVKAGLGLAASLSEAFPPAQIVVGVLKKIVDITDQYLVNEEDMKHVVERIVQIHGDLENAKHSGTECQPRKHLENTLNNVFKGLGTVKSSHVMSKALKADSISARIKKYLLEIEGALNRYHLSLTQETHDLVIDVHDEQLIKQVSTNTAHNARFRSEQPGCLEGTRTVFLEELRQWASDPSAPQLYWLNGYSGTGKTAIAQSFANALWSKGDLGATFFCSWNSPDRSETKRILPTLSYQLSGTSDKYRQALLRELKAHHGVGDSLSIQTQLDHLIIAPAKASNLSTVIIIDALDECRDKSQIKILLSLLVSRLTEIPSIKLFITSHRDTDIEGQFTTNPSSPNDRAIDKELDTVDGVEDDISLFIKTELAIAASERKKFSIPDEWPHKESVDVLVQKAAGLFVFASTAVKAVKTKGYHPVERLEQLTTSDDHPNGKNRADNPYVELDKLYLRILKIPFPPENKAQGCDLRSILGLIALTYEPLTCATINQLLSYAPETSPLIPILECLHPFLKTPEDQETPVTFYHQSFLDFLSNPERCQDPSLYVNPHEHHLSTARYCLDLMGKQCASKGKNICNIPRYTSNKELVYTDASKFLDQGIRYPCRYWSRHLLEARDHERHEGESSTTTLNSLSSFFETTQSWWLEALSLLQEPQRATEMLDNARSWLSSLGIDDTDQYARLVQWTEEGKQFVFGASEVLGHSAAHIYHSALPFCPTTSLYRQLADTFAATEAKVIVCADKSWPTSGPGTTFSELARKITFAHFSLDGTFVISGTQDKTTRIWDATDGTSSAILHEQSSKFEDGTFLSDNTYVVCYAKNGSLVLWDRTKAYPCDQDTTTFKEHGHFRQIFPSTHRPHGFFTTHTPKDAQTGDANWRVCYWEVVQGDDRSSVVGGTSSGEVARLRLLAYGTMLLHGGPGMTQIHHEAASGTTISTVTVLCKGDQYEFVSSGMDINASLSSNSGVTRLVFTQTKKPTDGTSPSISLQDPRTYVDSESPCLQSDDYAWIMDERSRRILWVPPAHRGEHGRWWKKDEQRKLLLEGVHGRLTVADFSHVDMDTDDVPF